MINVKPDIYAALSASCIGADVSDEYPKEWKTFPKVTFTEENNSVAVWTDDQEKDTRIVIRIDCWDNVSTSNVVAQIDAAMSSLGFLRTQCGDVPVREDFKHKQMRYEALLATDDDHVFHEQY